MTTLSPASLPARYENLVRGLMATARADDEIIGLLLTGSLARGDALPGTDIDVRCILADGGGRPFEQTMRDGVLVECGYADVASAQARLESHPMNVYAYLDGRILYDPRGVLEQLRQRAQQRFDTYRAPEQERSTNAFLLQCARDKICVAMAGGDELKAAFVIGTSSWQLMEGLWAANNRPLPPNSSVRPHLVDLVGPPEIAVGYRELFLADTPERIRVALELIDWILPRLRDDVAGGDPCSPAPA